MSFIQCQSTSLDNPSTTSQAARCGNLKALKELIDKGKCNMINRKPKFNINLLYLAAALRLQFLCFRSPCRCDG